MAVPLLDVNAQNHPLEAEFMAVFAKVLKEGRFIMGPEIGELEQEIAGMVGAAHGISVSSGTDALLLALMAMGIGRGDEVLCPAFTFFATAGAVHRLGAVPVFVDVCPVCFNLDVADAAGKITERTRAIIPVHLFGQSADMDSILALAAEHDLKVLEDAAQSIGAQYKGRFCGAMGEAGIFSFFPSKNLGGLGDGGMVVTSDDALAARMRSLRNHGMEPKYYHSEVGGNFRMDTLQAALLLVKLRHYASYAEGRTRNALRYAEALGALPGVVVADERHCACVQAQQQALHEAGARLVLPVVYGHNKGIWNQYTLRVLNGRRDELKAWLLGRGIGCEVYYPLTLDQQACFSGLPAHALSGCETAHLLADQVLSLPVYAEMTEQQQAEVVEAVAAFLAQ